MSPTRPSLKTILALALAMFRSLLRSTIVTELSSTIVSCSTMISSFERMRMASPHTLIARPARVRHFSSQTFAARRGADDDSVDRPIAGCIERPKIKRKSRKQRRAATKALNLTRVDKVLARRGVGSRSMVFELVKSKRVKMASSADAPHEERMIVASPKEKVPFQAALFLDGNLLPGPAPLLIVYHKPKYVLSVMEDDPKYQDQQRRHLGQVLEPRYSRAGMHPVGRLDYDTTGLILFSLEGKLTQRLLHPRRGVEKEYVATVRGLANESQLARKLFNGVKTAEGVHRAKLISVSPSEGPGGDGDLSEEIMLVEEEYGNGMGTDDEGGYSGPYSDVRLVVHEGKHRMVRRMLANCGHPVDELRRERHGMVKLGDLLPGEFRDATEEELRWARSLIE